MRSGREIPVLERAQRSHVKRALWQVAAGVVGGFGLLSLSVAILVILGVAPSLVGLTAMLGSTAVPFVVAALSWVTARRHTKERDVALAEAWALVAGDVLAQKGEELTSAELAKIMRTSEAHADELLGQLNVTDFVHARVTEEGELAYSVAPAKLRVDEQAAAEAPEEAEEDEAAVRARSRVERP